MTRQVTDNLYIELDYFTPEEYYIYEAVAASTQSTEFAVACDAEIIAGGGIIEANATFNSEGTTSIAVSKIASGEAAFVLEFTQNTTISHIHGSDLFAFNEAAIAVLISRIRDTNTDATDIFDIATDFVRIRTSDAAIEAVISSSVIGERSRATTIETQAAFSFDCVSDKIKLATSSINAEVSFYCDATEITPFSNGEAYINSEFTLVSNSGKIHLSSIVLETAFNLTATISHIEGAELIAFTDAALSAQAEIIKDNQSQVNSAFDLQKSMNRIRNSDKISMS
jgi:hypothetical protein